MIFNQICLPLDWSPAPSPPSGMVGVPMLWGGGSSKDKQDATRLSAFKAITTSPKYIIGFEEPDCSTEGSSSMSVDKGKSNGLSTDTDD
jgi:hypothetical protein